MGASKKRVSLSNSVRPRQDAVVVAAAGGGERGAAEVLTAKKGGPCDAELRAPRVDMWARSQGQQTGGGKRAESFSAGAPVPSGGDSTRAPEGRRQLLAEMKMDFPRVHRRGKRLDNPTAEKQTQ